MLKQLRAAACLLTSRVSSSRIIKKKKKISWLRGSRTSRGRRRHKEEEVICIFLIDFLACYLHIYIGFLIIEKLLE